MLSLALVLAPVVHGLYAHSFNLTDYLLPRLEEVEEVLGSIGPQSVRIEYEGAALRRVEVDGGGAELELSLAVRNGLPLALRVEDLSFYVVCSDHNERLGTGSLKEAVEIPPGGRRVVGVSVRSMHQEVAHVLSYHVYTAERGLVADLAAIFKDVYLRLSAGGVSAETRSDFGPFRLQFELGGSAP